MKAICGWFGKDPRNTGEFTVSHMTAAIPGATQKSVQETLKQAAVSITGEGPESLHIDKGVLVALNGIPYWRNKHTYNNVQSRATAGSILERYLDMGIDLLRDLGGGFALAILDTEQKCAFLAVDRMGQKNLVYTQVGRELIFSSSCDALLAHPRVNAKIEPQSIFHYLYFHVVPGTSTVFSNLKRIAPGHYIQFEQDTLENRPYWTAVFAEHSVPFSDRRTEFRRLLDDSVARCLGDGKPGAFLSGGTDSSTIAGILSKQQNPVDVYSIGFDEPGYDETEYARITAKHFGLRHHVYLVTPHDIVSAIPMIAKAYDLPFGNASAVPTYYCAKVAAQDDVKIMLGGDGGDELFGGNARYAEQVKFSLYEQLPAPLRTGLRAAFSYLPSDGRGGLIGKAKSYIEAANIPMPLRLERYNLLRRLGIENLFTSDFLSLIAPEGPDDLLRKHYDTANAKHMINKMLALDFNITLADNDLLKVTRMCELAGTDARFPLLDDEIVEFSLKLPASYKVRGLELRYFFKEALKDFLPEEVLKKSKHGFGLPFGVWLSKHRGLYEISQDSLSDFSKRGIVRSEFLDRLMRDYLDQHSGYYGTLVWVLMMLEQWFQIRASRWQI